MINTHVWQPGCFTKPSVLSRCAWTLGVLSGVVLFRWREEENIQIVFSGIRHGSFYQGWSDDVTYPVSPQDIQLITAVSPYYIWLFRLHLSFITEEIIWEIMTHCSLGLFFFFFTPVHFLWLESAPISNQCITKANFDSSAAHLNSHHLDCKFVLKMWEKYFSDLLSDLNLRLFSKLYFILCKL